MARFEEQAQEQGAAAEEALDSAKAALVAQYMSMFHKFELLDTVFTEFLRTNSYRGAHHDLAELLRIKTKRFFRFQHLSSPYVGTVSTADGHDVDWVNITLGNDGFVYTNKAGAHVQRHTSAGWIALPEDRYQPHIPGLTAAVQPLYGSMRAFCNPVLQRFDIKLYPRSAQTPHLLLTFEPGYPDRDDAVPLHAVPAGKASVVHNWGVGTGRS